MTKTTTRKTTKKATCGTSKKASCKPKRTVKKIKVGKTDGLSNLDVGESHVITDEEVAAIVNEDTSIEKKAAAPKAEENKEINPLQNLTPYEFQVTISVLPSVQNAKQILKELEKELKDKDLEDVTYQKLEVLKELNIRTEMGIWNSMAKKFGYDTLEAAQEAGVKLTIKSGHFVQALNA